MIIQGRFAPDSVFKGNFFVQDRPITGFFECKQKRILPAQGVSLNHATPLFPRLVSVWYWWKAPPLESCVAARSRMRSRAGQNHVHKAEQILRRIAKTHPPNPTFKV